MWGAQAGSELLVNFRTCDDDVYFYIRWRLKLEGETENTGNVDTERGHGGYILFKKDASICQIVETIQETQQCPLLYSFRSGHLRPRPNRHQGGPGLR